MKELILSPEEIYYIGKVSGGKYLDYDYIAAMQDIGKRGKIKAQEILDGLERKGYAEEDFLGNLEVEPACTEMLQPVYQGMYESELILREESGASVHYKFHHMENRITSVECHAQEYMKENGIQGRKPYLTQYMGMNPEEVRVLPYMDCLQTKRGDRFLICSDGVSDMVPVDFLETMMQQTQSTAKCVDAILTAALDAGGKDNITAIVLEINR